MNSVIKKIILIGFCGAAALFLLALLPVFNLTGTDESGALKTQCRINFLGLKHGAYREYAGDGTLMLDGHYFLGRQSGRWIWSAKNGSKKAECDYSAKPSSCKAFYASGGVQEESFVVPENTRHVSDLFLKKGTSQYEASFRTGDLDGLYKQFYSNGQMKIEGHYKNGLPQGTWNFYRKNGKLRETDEYVGDLFDITVKKQSYYEDGAFAFDGMSGSSVTARNRTNQVFYETGGVFFKMQLRDNVPMDVGFFDPAGNSLIICDVDEAGFFCGLDSNSGTGSTKVVQAVYENGSPALKVELSGGRLNGQMTRYYQAGGVASILSFDHGALSGDAFFYDEKGELEHAASYENWKVKTSIDYDEDGGKMNYPNGL